MRISPSWTSAGSTSNTLLSRSRGQFSAPHHHLQPSRSPPSTARIHPNPPLFHITLWSSRLPSPCSRPHTGCTARAAGSPTRMRVPIQSAHTMSTTIYAALPGRAHPSICRRLFPPLTLHRLRTQPTQTARTPMFAFPSGGRNAARRWSSLFRRPSDAYDNLERPSANLGGGGATTALSPLPSGAHDVEAAHLLCGPQYAHDNVGRPAAAVDGRCGRAAVQAQLPAQDHLLLKPAGDAADRRRQV